MVLDSTFRRTPRFHLQALLEGLFGKDRVFLSQAITLIESKLPVDQSLASELLDQVLPKTGKSFKIGITGVPGVGKSTFIEGFGKLLTSKGLSVAVLSIDPTSQRSRGSILGDKTRMNELSKDPKAFIRPSASGASLGGVASNTREAALLCEAAGFDIIIIETVGVGQSETVVKNMVDYFLLLMLPGGGDELQGIKRGIMEIADHIVINKSEGENKKRAQRAAKEYQNAIHLFPPNESEWVVPVGLCSAIEQSGLEDIWNHILSFQDQMTNNGWLGKNRKSQLISWFHERIEDRLKQHFYQSETTIQQIKEKEDAISSHQISVRKAVDSIFTVD